MAEEIQKLTVDLYIRVSTGRQAKEGDSLEEQESELKKFCDYRGFKIHKIYIEKGKSGGSTNRPEYQALLKDVEVKKINAVVVKKIDRLSRSLLDFEAFMKLLQDNNIEFISIKESFDTTTAMGKAMLRVALVFAQLEREQNSERTVDVMHFRATQGFHNGGITPFGYTTVNKELVSFKKEKEIVEYIFDKFLELKSTTAVTKLLNESNIAYRNNKPWLDTKIHVLLQNPIYIGNVRWKKNVYPGIHPPIISVKKFDDVQAIFNSRRYLNQKGKTNAILQRLLYCGYCSSPMTPSYAFNRHKQKYFYYRCTSTHHGKHKRITCNFKYTSLPDLEKRVLNLLLSLSEETQFKPLENRILKFNQDIFDEETKIKQKIAQLKQSLDELKLKKDRYLDSLISGQYLSIERKRINEKIEELELEEKQLKAQMMKAEFEFTEKSDEKINLSQFKKSLIMFKTNQDTLTPPEFKTFLNTTIKEIHYFPDKLLITFRLLPWPIDFQS